MNPILLPLVLRLCRLTRRRSKSGWEDIASLVEGGLGIHCCSNTDWEFVLGLNPSVVSIDAYTTAKEFLLYADTITGYMERGGVVAWGIVPADSRVFVTETTGIPVPEISRYPHATLHDMPEDLFDAQSLITPSAASVLPIALVPWIS